MHKDPNDTSKLRPIVVGGAWRRALTSLTVKHNTRLFTEFLAPYNFAIGVKGGETFVYNTINIEVKKYIQRSEEQLRHNPPSRCLISLDICNMFNKTSRERARDIIKTNFPHLLNISDLLLNDPTECHYLKPNREWGFFEQEEGLPQGCPFSPVFASLVLNTIIKSLDESLKKRATSRKRKKIFLDDGDGGVTNLLSYVDNLNAVVPHEDCLHYCQEFERLTNELGLKIKK